MPQLPSRVSRPLVCLLLSFCCAGGLVAADASGPTKPLAHADLVRQATTPDGHRVEAVGDEARITCAMQALEGRLTPQGLSIGSVSSREAGVCAVQARSLGRERDGSRLGAGRVVVESGMASLVRPGLVEEVTTSGDGIRQDWVVLERPAGDGELVLGVGIADADITAVGDGRIDLTVAGGRKLVWRDLAVTDAEGAVVAARFAPAADGVQIRIADAGRRYPLRIDPTFADADWLDMDGGMNGSVYALAVMGGDVYVAGSFSMAGSVNADAIAKWDGESWSPLGTGVDGHINALAVLNGSIYAGGYFSTAGGIAARNIARWNGTSWSALGAGTDDEILALTVAGTNLFAGGWFDSAGGIWAHRIAVWTGTYWAPLGSGLASGWVDSLTYWGGCVYAGGSFNLVDGILAYNIARWNGSSWSALGTGTNGEVLTILPTANSIYIGGGFTLAGGVAANHIASWNGIAWSALGVGTNNEVHALALSGSNIYAGGDFTTAGGMTVNYIAKWSGSSWSALGSGMEYSVRALAVTGGDIYAGGLFWEAGGTTCYYVAHGALLHPPVITEGASVTVTMSEDGGPIPFGLDLHATDSDGDSMTWSVSSLASHGTATAAGSGGSKTVSYVPNPNFSGSDSFAVRVSDGGRSDTITVNVTILPVPDLPVIAEGATTEVIISQDGIPTAFALTLHAADGDGDPLGWTISSAASHGTATASGTGAGIAVGYTPGAGYAGSDSFVVQVSDGTGRTDSITVDVTVLPPPVITQGDSVSVTMSEDGSPTAFALTLDATGAAGSALSWSISSAAAHGTATAGGTGASKVIGYIPDGDHSGSDSFVVEVENPAHGTDTITVDVTIEPVNDAPVGTAQTVTAVENSARTITLAANDVEGDTLVWATPGSPAHGVLSGTAPNLTYTPAGRYIGDDSFTFQVGDGLLDSSPAIVTIHVVADHAPVAVPDGFSTAVGTPVALTLTATDVDGNPLTYQVVATPRFGRLSDLDSQHPTYTPSPNFTGLDSFTFKAKDGLLYSNTATITVGVGNAVPVPRGQSITMAEDTSRAITLSASDPDLDKVILRLGALPAHGVLTGKLPRLTYRPEKDYNGGDSFTFFAGDGADESEATIGITVTPVNDAPVATAQAYATPISTPILLSLEASDTESAPLSWILSRPAHGALSDLTSQQPFYIPASGFRGKDSFTFKVNDGNLYSRLATVVITVDNNAPAAIAASFTVAEDSAKSIRLTAADANANRLVFSIVAPPVHGTLSGLPPAVSYRPERDYTGPDQFSFSVNDGVSSSNVAVISLTVTAANDAPRVQGQTVSTAMGASVPITLTATDPDGPILFFIQRSGPANGYMDWTPPVVTYHPAPGFQGVDTFTFKAGDSRATSASATVRISVGNREPVTTPQAVTLVEDAKSKAITLLVTDADRNPLTYRVYDVPAHGTLSGTAPKLVFRPDRDFCGADSFTYMANDGFADSVLTTVSIDVTAVNDAPVAVPQELVTDTDAPLAITLDATDVDNAGPTYALVAAPRHGTLDATNVLAGTLIYTPAAGYVGTDVLSFKAKDGVLFSKPATIRITVGSGGVGALDSGRRHSPAGEACGLLTNVSAAVSSPVHQVVSPRH